MSDSGDFDGLFRPTPPSSGSPALPPELSPRGAPPRRSAPGGSGGGRGGSSGRARTILTWTAGTLAMVVLAISGIGFVLLGHYDSKINREDVFGQGAARQQAAPGAPMNILLVGSDSRLGLTRGQRNKLSTGQDQGARSDTMILMHVSADNQYVTMVSFPRDSYVTIPSYKDAAGVQHPESKNKINASYAYGGPSLTIRTIEANTGLTIDHYVEVNIAGFVKMVDALGGADVCIKKAVDDKDSGLTLSAGKHHLNGAQSLAYVRARHIYADQDLGRIRAQQAFIGSVAKQALSAQTLTNPIKLNRFLDAALSTVTTDTQLDKKTILTLANRFREVNASQITFVTVPLSNSNYLAPGVGSAVKWSGPLARQLFDKIKADQPVAKPVKATKAKATAVTVSPGRLSVQVFNGTGTAGLGTKAADDLTKVGFTMAGPAKNWKTTGTTKTLILYDPAYDVSVKTLAAAIPGATLQAKAGLGRTFQVVAGSDWAGAKTVTVVAAPSPTATAGPSSIATKSAAEVTCT